MIFDKANELDRNDPLKDFQGLFTKPSNLIYLDGNSLGMLPKITSKRMEQVINDEWGQELIGSWNKNWLELNKRVENKLGQIINADAQEIFVGDSTSINLYKLAKALMQSKKYQKNFVTDNLNFPSDRYILSGIADYDNITYQEIIFDDLSEANLPKIEHSFKNHPGVYCFSLTTYLSAYLYPVKKINRLAKKFNSIVIWDFSHAIGAVEIDVKQQEILAAVGCTYKHLNGGPGAPGFLFVEKETNESMLTPIQGWFGHSKTFDFADEYQKGAGSKQYKVGTPNILSLAAMECGLDITLEATVSTIRSKNLTMAKFVQDYIQDELKIFGVEVFGPTNELSRGGHLTVTHSENWRICKALQEIAAPKIITDFRPDSFMRIAFTPLYTSYEELAYFLNSLKNILETKSYLSIDSSRPEVT